MPADFADRADFENAQRGLIGQGLQRLGYGAENATWRNCFLMGAQELRDGIKPTALAASGMARAMTVTQLFDTIAIRIDGPRAVGTALSVLWHFTDSDERYFMQLSNGVLIHHPTRRAPQADLTVSLTHPQLLGLLASGSLDGIGAAGDPSVLQRLMSLTGEPDRSFPVVTP